MMSWRAGALLIAPLALTLIVFFLAPILLLVPMSFGKNIPGNGVAAGVWTVANYAQLVTDDYYREVILRTFGLGAAVTFACLLLGYPLAYLIARGPERWRVPLVMLVIFPMMLNLVVRSFGWIALLANHGLVNNLLIQLGLISHPLKLIFNFAGVMIGMTHIYLPFMVLMLSAAIRALPADVEAAAATLGSSRAHVFLAVTLPLTAPGMSRRLHPRVRPFHQRARRAAHARRPDLRGDGDANPRRVRAAARLAERIGSLLRADLSRRGGDLDFEPADPTLGGRGMNDAGLTRPRAFTTAFALVVIAFLELPVIIIVLTAFSSTAYLTLPPKGLTLKWFAKVLSDPDYLSAIRVSLVLALGSTVLSLLLGVSAAHALFRKVIPGSGIIAAFLMSPLVMPGVVLGVALLQFYSLTSTRGMFLGLLFAHVVITVPYVVRSALASLGGLDMALEEAARVLGADRIHGFPAGDPAADRARSRRWRPVRLRHIARQCPGHDLSRGAPPDHAADADLFLGRDGRRSQRGGGFDIVDRRDRARALVGRAPHRLSPLRIGSLSMPLTSRGFPLFLTFDLDAETMWTARDPSYVKRPILMSQGAYGWKVGTPRILDLLDRYDLKIDVLRPGTGDRPARGLDGGHPRARARDRASQLQPCLDPEPHARARARGNGEGDRIDKARHRPRAARLAVARRGAQPDLHAAAGRARLRLFLQFL